MEITGEVKLKKNQNTSLIEKKLKATNYKVVEVTDDRILIEKRAQKGDITLGEGKARYRIYFDDYHIYLQSLLIFVFLSIVGWALLKTNIIGYFGFRNILLIAILTALSTHDATRASIKNTITNKVFGQKDFFLENLNRNFLLRIGVALGASYLLEYAFTLTPRFLAGVCVNILLCIIIYYKYPKEASKRDRPVEESKYKSRRKIWYIAIIIVAIPILYFSILVKSLGTFIMMTTGVSFFLREIIMRDLFELPFGTNIKRFLITLGFICIGGLISFIEYLKGGY